jgi:hypothetical protein
MTSDLLWYLVTLGLMIATGAFAYWRGRTKLAREDRSFTHWKNEVLLDIQLYIEAGNIKAERERGLAELLARCPKEYTSSIVDGLRIGHAVEDYARYEAKKRGLYPTDMDLGRERYGMPEVKPARRVEEAPVALQSYVSPEETEEAPPSTRVKRTIGKVTPLVEWDGKRFAPPGRKKDPS